MLINCHSYYSLRYGTLSIDELVSIAKQRGHSKLLLSDINNSTAIIDFVKECKKQNIIPAAGIEFRADGDLLYIGIAKNNVGFQQLNSFLTEHNLQKKNLPKRAPMLSDVVFVYDFQNIHLLSNLRPNEFIGIRYFYIAKKFD